MSKEYPKVYFSNSFLQSCYYVRCLIPLQAGGWDGDKTAINNEAIPPEVRAKAVLDADVVVFHRPNDWRSLDVAKKLREQGKKIVADNDDTYKHIDAKVLGKALKRVDKGLDEFVKFADMVTCSTEFLANEYRLINPNVVVLPNCVDPDVWPEPLRNEGEKVRIGLIGSVAINDDYKAFEPVIKHLSERDDVTLVVFALPTKDKSTEQVVQDVYKKGYDFWEKYNIEWHPFVGIDQYIDALNEMRIDIAVVPRADDYFNRCKSNLKFLECSMLEIPCVVRGFTTDDSPYQVNKADRNFLDMVLDDDFGTWMAKIEPLIQDKQLRRSKGAAAHKYVLENYDIKYHIHKWTEAYQKLLS